MSTTTIPTSSTEATDRELVITRVFDAPRSLVFACWTQPAHCQKWFAPRGCTMLDFGGDPRPGGAWHMTMLNPAGETFKEMGEYKEIVPDERLVFSHAWEGDDGQPEHWTQVTVEFADEPGGKTFMTFTQGIFRSTESRDNHRHGWGECFALLSEHLAAVAA